MIDFKALWKKLIAPYEDEENEEYYYAANIVCSRCHHGPFCPEDCAVSQEFERIRREYGKGS